MNRFLSMLFIVTSLFFLTAIIGSNTQATFSFSQDTLGTLTPTPVNPYPAPEDDNMEATTAVANNDFPYPPPESDIVPITNPVTSYSYSIYLPSILKPSISYNRVNAIIWADEWAKRRHPCFPNYGTGSDCTDCTNYLSQVLFAGGLPLIYKPSWDINAWYYWCDDFCVCTNSNTWSATDWFNAHISQLQEIRYDQKSSVDDLSAGDFMILDLVGSPFHGMPNHARVIVGWGFVQEGDILGDYALLASQHCIDRYRIRWDYNLTEDDYIWYWHVGDLPTQ